MFVSVGSAGCDDPASSTDAEILFTMGTGVGGFGSTFGGREDGDCVTTLRAGDVMSLDGGLPVTVGGVGVSFTTFCVTGCGGGTTGMENWALGRAMTGDVGTVTPGEASSEVVVPEAHLLQDAPG
ncbi:hypothetical protein D7W79_27770 [Corallococcus exercitus]|nr:hypothetical protein D7W79_27770 [Corallococcus exercitus]